MVWFGLLLVLEEVVSLGQAWFLDVGGSIFCL